MWPGVWVSHHLRVIIHAMYRRCFVNQVQERGVVHCSDLFSAETNTNVETMVQKIPDYRSNCSVTNDDRHLQSLRIAPSSKAPCDPWTSAVLTGASCISSCGCACMLAQEVLTPHCCPIALGKYRQGWVCTAFTIACRPLRLEKPIAAISHPLYVAGLTEQDADTEANKTAKCATMRVPGARAA